jgi:transposase
MPNRVRRLLALAAIYDGASRTQAAEIGGVTLQVVRDWVLRLSALGPEGLIDRKAPDSGRASGLEYAKARPWLLGDAGLRRTQACAVSQGSSSCRLPRPA